MKQNATQIQALPPQHRSPAEPSLPQGDSSSGHNSGQEAGDHTRSDPSTLFPDPGMVLPTGEVAVYCDCCPHKPKKMAVIQPHTIQIISRRSGRKHIARIPIRHLPSPSPVRG